MNVGSLRGRDGEIVDIAERGHLDLCCLQETRWKGEGARMLGDIIVLDGLQEIDSRYRAVGG